MSPERARASRGRRFKAAVLRDYELSAAELELLEEAARTLDTLDDPSLPPREARQHREVLRRLLAALGLEAGETSAEVSRKARRAARARWRRVVGEAS